MLGISSADTNRRPRREEWDISDETCELASRRIELRLKDRASLSDLRLWLAAAKSSKEEQKRSRQLEKILEELGPDSSNREKEFQELRRDVLFELHARTVEKHIRRGIEGLELPCAPIEASLCSRFVFYRQEKTGSLDQALDNFSDGEDGALSTDSQLDKSIDETAAEAWESAQKLKWICKHDSCTARAAARRRSAKFSESGSNNSEGEMQRQEKLPLLTHLIMNKLYPIWKEDVIAIHQALYGMAHPLARLFFANKNRTTQGFL